MNVTVFQKTHFKRILQLVLVGFISYFLFQTFYKNWDKVTHYTFQINYRLLGMSFFCMVFSSLCVALGWNILLRFLGGRLGYLKALKIFYLGSIARYVPGKVWGIAGQVYLCKQQSISIGRSSASIVLQLAVQVVSGILVFFFSLFFWNEAGTLVNITSLSIICCLGLIGLHPALMQKITTVVLKKFKRNPVHINITYMKVLLLVVLFCFFWFLGGIAFFLLISSVYGIPLSLYPVITGIYAISWVISFLSFLTPSGIGVFEAVSVFFLSIFMPLHVATIIAIISRLLRIGTDLACVALTVKF